MPKGSTLEYRIKKLEKGPLQRFKNQNLLIKKFGEIGLQVYKAITGKRTTGELKKDLGIDPKMFDQVLEYMQNAGMVELEPTVKGKEEITPEEEAMPEEEFPLEEEAPSLEELPPEEELVKEEETPPLEEERREEEVEEIKPIGTEEEEAEEEKPEEETPPEEEITFEGAEEAPPEKEAPPEEEVPEGEEKITAFAEEEAYEEESSDLSPVEKIISDKYGDLGLQVYSLIDGARTAEEIMRDTGLSEPKLVEILDFMDEQGIIKLDYPKGGPPPTTAPPTGAPPPTPKREEGFAPMLEEEKKLEEARGVLSPVGLPIKAPLDIVRSVQMKAKTMLKYGDKGGKMLELMNGKNDILDISLKLDMPLYKISDILNYMLQNGMVIMKPLTRTDVRQKYGDDGYSVYKKYGKEGLMLYELIGKELTIKQMADKITKDRAKIIDIFIFIHKVLGIELPIDKNILAKELGL